MGNTNASRSPIFVYEYDSRKLVGEYTSLFEASKSLEIPYTTLRRYLSNGKVWNNKFIIRSSPRPPSNPCDQRSRVEGGGILSFVVLLNAHNRGKTQVPYLFLYSFL